MLAAGDLVSGAAALLVANFVTGLVVGNPPTLSLMPALGLLGLIYFMMGMYGDGAQCVYTRFRLRCISVIEFVLLHIVLFGTGLDPTTSAIKIVSEAGLLVALGFYAELGVQGVLTRAGLWSTATVIVGCDPAAERLYRLLSGRPDLGFRPIGFLRSPADGCVPVDELPGPVRDDFRSFTEPGEEQPVAILTSSAQFSLLGMIGVRPSRLILASDVSDLPASTLRIRPLGNSVGIQLETGARLSRNRALKRLIDLSVAIPAAILVAPLLGFLCLLIKLVDGGSPFYFQQRVGVRGAVFKLPKLRTMYRDADLRLKEHLAGNPEAKKEWERFFKLSDDPRILPVIGNFLRRFSLDELPQLWSVITGDMSLVGPRPFPQYHLNSFDAEFQQVRATVVPGLTGLWQVMERSNGDLDVQRTQDTFYIRNWSIWLDLYILLKTVPAVLTGNGAR